MTSAADELRRLLDVERVVEWHISNEKGATFWTGQFGIGYYARQNDDGETLHMLGVDLTPEQAVEATLGPGTCRDVGRYAFVCSVCGWASDEPHHVLGGFWPKYCPECGRKVVE